MTVNIFNQHPINRQAAQILRQYQIPFNPETELAALALVRTALERNLLETGPIPEPLLLIAKLAAQPKIAMSLMTESEPGVEFEIELSETLEEAAAEILEELVASLQATVPKALQ